MVRVHPCLPASRATDTGARRLGEPDDTRRPSRRGSPTRSGGGRQRRSAFMTQINVTLPDGSQRSLPAGAPVRDVAEAISPRLAQAAFAALVDGRLVDLSYPLQKDAAVRIVTDRSPEALALYRPSTWHLYYSRSRAGRDFRQKPRRPGFHWIHRSWSSSG